MVVKVDVVAQQGSYELTQKSAELLFHLFKIPYSNSDTSIHLITSLPIFWPLQYPLTFLHSRAALSLVYQRQRQPGLFQIFDNKSNIVTLHKETHILEVTVTYVSVGEKYVSLLTCW